MPMTRELKKRFMAVEDRLEKIEKRKPVQRTNGEDPDSTLTQEMVENNRELVKLLEGRCDQIEMVLQIPGETDGETQVLSAWRQTVETVLKKLEDRILKVELRGAWTPDEARDLEGRVKTINLLVEEIQLAPDPSKAILEFDDRLTKLERTPVAGSLSNILGDVTLSIEGTNREVKELRSLIRRTTLWVLVFFAITFLLLALSFYLL